MNLDNYILLDYCELELVVHRAAKFVFLSFIETGYAVQAGLELYSVLWS